MKLIIVRHGESEANKEGIHQGQIVDTSKCVCQLKLLKCML